MPQFISILERPPLEDSPAEQVRRGLLDSLAVAEHPPEITEWIPADRGREYVLRQRARTVLTDDREAVALASLATFGRSLGLSPDLIAGVLAQELPR